MQLIHLYEICEAKMIEPSRIIPASCSQRIVDLNTLWKQLDDNWWLFVAPASNILTVLCSKHEPMDVKLLGTGKLQLNHMCKAYGSRILIQSHATIVSNRTSKYIIPPMSLEYVKILRVTLTYTIEKRCQFSWWFENCHSQSRRRWEINTWTRVEG